VDWSDHGSHPGHDSKSLGCLILATLLLPSCTIVGAAAGHETAAIHNHDRQAAIARGEQPEESERSVTRSVLIGALVGLVQHQRSMNGRVQTVVG